MRWLLALVALGISWPSAPVAVAQEAIDEETARSRSRIPHYDALKQATTRGREMYLYDQAAWHATDQFLEDWGSRPTNWLRGYFVEPGEDDRLTAVFFGEQEGKLVEAARYHVAGSAVIGGGLHGGTGRPELSPLGKSMIDARQAALEEASEQEFSLCTRSPPNTLILPPDAAGTITVYVLTPPTSNEGYPMGGHYRIEIGSDGHVRSSRRFMNTCIDAPVTATGAPAGSTMQAFGVSHLLDPHPTEVHVFASYYLPVMLMVTTTENKQMWSVRQGSVGYVGHLDELSEARRSAR